MEKEIMFIKCKEIYSKKKDTKYYTVTYLVDQDCLNDFVTEEVYNKILSKNIPFLSKCKAVFYFNICSKRIQLIDIK